MSAFSSLWSVAASIAAMDAPALGLQQRQGGAGRLAAGEGGGGEGCRQGRKMPLVQHLDPWQKMAVESPSDSAEFSEVTEPENPIPVSLNLSFLSVEVNG